MVKRALIATLLTLGIPGASHAQTFWTQSTSATINRLSFGVSTTTAFSPPVSKFDPALGDLNLATAFTETTFRIRTEGVWSGASGRYNLSVRTSDSFLVNNDVISPLVNVETKTNFFLTNNSLYRIDWSFSSGKRTSLNTQSYVGSGNVPISWRTEISGSGFGQFSNFTASITSVADVNTTYKYTAVPEPGTLAAIGIGIAAMLRRRVRR